MGRLANRKGPSLKLEQVTDFRPIQYLGNKSRLLDLIEDAISSVATPDARVCDLFAGSGVVARRLALKRPVLASDIQEYSRVLTASLLMPSVDQNVLEKAMTSAMPRVASAVADLIEQEGLALDDALQGDPERLCEIIEAGTILRHRDPAKSPDSSLVKRLRVAADAVPTGPGTVLVRYYGGLYFSFRQAIELDALANAARRLTGSSRDVALAAVIGTASEVVSTVGNQFAQPVQPRAKDGSIKRGLLKAVARKRRVSVTETFSRFVTRYMNLDPASEGPHHVVRRDYRELLSSPPLKVGVIYADPPYTRDHYSRFYHVLETVALGDEPPVSETGAAGARVLSRALYRTDRHQSPFCIRTQAAGAFDELFRRAHDLGAPVVLSYSPYSGGTAARPQPRVLTIENLAKLAGKYFSTVDVRAGGDLVHSRLNREELSRDIDHAAEVLLVAS